LTVNTKRKGHLKCPICERPLGEHTGTGLTICAAAFTLTEGVFGNVTEQEKSND